MADDPGTIRRRIEHYRSLLAQGTSSDVARMYLDQIAKAHAALRELEQAKPPAPKPTPRQGSGCSKV